MMNGKIEKREGQLKGSEKVDELNSGKAGTLDSLSRKPHRMMDLLQFGLWLFFRYSNADHKPIN